MSEMANMSAGFRSKQTHGYYTVTKVLAQASHVSDKTRKMIFTFERRLTTHQPREDISLTTTDVGETEESEISRNTLYRRARS